MTTLLSKNQEEIIVLKMPGYRIEAGYGRLLVGSQDELDRAEKFLDEHGFGGLYFSHEDPIENYEHYEWEHAHGVCHGVRFFN